MGFFFNVLLCASTNKLKFFLEKVRISRYSFGALTDLLDVYIFLSCLLVVLVRRVAEVAREHGWHTPKSLDSDENFKPEHTRIKICRDLHTFFLEIFGQKKCLFG